MGGSRSICAMCGLYKIYKKYLNLYIWNNANAQWIKYSNWFVHAWVEMWALPWLMSVCVHICLFAGLL